MSTTGVPRISWLSVCVAEGKGVEGEGWGESVLMLIVNSLNTRVKMHKCTKETEPKNTF